MRTSHAEASNPLSRNPLFAIAVSFAVGIFLFRSLETDLRPFLFGFIFALIFSVFIERLLTVCVLAAFVFAGALFCGVELAGSPKNSIAHLYDNGWIRSGDPLWIVGNLSDHPQLSDGGMFLIVSASKIGYKKEPIRTSGTIRLFLATDSVAAKRCLKRLDLRAGNELRISARLKRENTYLNPGSANTIDLLDRRGVDATATLKSCFLIEKTGDDYSVFSFAYEFREFLTARIIETHDRRTAGIVLASLLGNKNFLTKDSGDTFRESGTFHVLIISGLHITLIGGLILLAVRRLASSRRTQFLISTIFLWAYATIIGLQLPVFRAALMYSIFLSGYAAYRGVSSLNSLGAAALTILVWRPADLFNPSFQLTFLSIFAIIGFAFPLIERTRITGSWMPTAKHPIPPYACKPLRIFSEALYWSELRWAAHLAKQNWDCSIEKTAMGLYFADSRAQRWGKRLFEVGIVSLSVQMFLLPLLIINFHRVGAASLLSNIFAGAAVAAQNVFSLIGLLISTISLEAARSFVLVLSAITDISLLFQDTLSQNFLRPVRIPVYTGDAALVYPLYYLPVCCLSVCIALWNPFAFPGPRKTVKKIAYCSLATTVGLAALMVFHPFSEPIPDGRLKVDFLDVGQGDSSLVTFPGGLTLLIDGGGMRELDDGNSKIRDVAGVGEKVVSEFLWERGYSSIDYVISTHPDADHINGLTDVIGNFGVRGVFAGGDFSNIREFQRLKYAAAYNRVPLKVVSEGMVLNFEGVGVYVLNPPRTRQAQPDNDDSVVVRIKYKTRSILFTGDIGARTEKRLCELNMPLAADVVKVAHHGSRTSSSVCFVKRTKAVYAVIPVGRRSPYGHPHREVVDRWEKSGSRVFTTGEDGTVAVSTDGSDLEIDVFEGPFSN